MSPTSTAAVPEVLAAHPSVDRAAVALVARPDLGDQPDTSAPLAASPVPAPHPKEQ